MKRKKTVVRAFEACHQVLSIVELAEEIMLHLPLKDLLLAQQVSRHWQSVWEGSVKIQRALFLEPMRGFLITREEGTEPKNDMNGENFDVWKAGPAIKLKHQPLLNPFLSRYVQRGSPEVGRGCEPNESPLTYTYVTSVHTSNPLYGQHAFKKWSAHYRTSTLSRMSILQPAADALDGLCDKSQDETLPWPAPYAMSTRDSYATVADFRRGCMNHWADCPDCPVSLEGDEEACWHWDGETDVRFVEVDEIFSGWEILAEMEKRMETTAL